MSIEAALFGSLSRDGEAKTSQSGKPYVRINVRVGDGEGAQWVNVTTFDPAAIASADKFVKGARVYVEGRLTFDKWKGQGGTERHGLSIMSWHCRLAQIGRNKPKRRSEGAQPNGTSWPAQGTAELNDEIPW